MPLTVEALLALQNGSDIRGVAMEGEKQVQLTPEVAQALGISFVRWLSKETGKIPSELKIGVGHDSRLTARTLTEGFLAGVTRLAKGYDCGLASTPAMFMSTVFPQSDFDGGVMLTASHLPMDRNGIKFFTRAGGLDKPDIRAILTDGVLEWPEQESQPAETLNLMNLYTSHLRRKIILGCALGNEPLQGLNIVVDAGNGAGGFFATEVLEPLGADVSGSVFLEPDGTFPNHQPNPENKAAMAAIQKATLAANADLGLIFDTDVDRASAVLPDGSEISRDALIAMLAALVAKEDPGCTVVTDSVTSHRLTWFLEEHLGLRHHRFKRGYKNVINEAMSIEAPLAIETSGHGALSENYYLDDGAYLAVKLVIATAIAKAEGKQLATLIAEFPAGFEEREYRIPCTAANPDEILEVFEQRAKERGIYVYPNTYEGVRISSDSGWVLLRRSLHDPLLPLNMEGCADGDCENWLQTVKELLQGLEGIDLQAL